MSIYLDVPVDVNEPHIRTALLELQALIAARYPDAVFTVVHGDDPEGIYLRAAVDTDDLDDVVDVVLARMVELNELGLPIYVIPVWPMARIRAHVQHEAKVPIEAR